MKSNERIKIFFRFFSDGCRIADIKICSVIKYGQFDKAEQRTAAEQIHKALFLFLFKCVDTHVLYAPKIHKVTSFISGRLVISVIRHQDQKSVRFIPCGNELSCAPLPMNSSSKQRNFHIPHHNQISQAND